MNLTEGLTIRASDTTGQRMANLKSVPPDYSVGELIDVLIKRMELPRNDSGGSPVSYQARHEREGRNLLSSEMIGEVLENEDEITLVPNVDAGAPL
jgi:hypothetical protein